MEKIRQKVIKQTPTDKLKDLLINMLAGGYGVADVNNRMRVDKALQLAFDGDHLAIPAPITRTRLGLGG